MKIATTIEGERKNRGKRPGFGPLPTFKSELAIFLLLRLLGQSILALIISLGHIRSIPFTKPGNWNESPRPAERWSCARQVKVVLAGTVPLV
jgi:hypothetical protein